MQSPDGRRRYEGMNLIASRHDASGGGAQGTVTAQIHPERLLMQMNIITSHYVWND